MKSNKYHWLLLATAVMLSVALAASPSYGTISFLGTDTAGDPTSWFDHLNWSSNTATTTLMPPFNNTAVDSNNVYTTNPTDTDIGSSSSNGAGPFTVNFDPANDPFFAPTTAINEPPPNGPRPLPYGYNDDNNSANGGTDTPAFVIWRLYLSAGENTATNTLNIKSGRLIFRDSSAGNLSANNFGSSGTAQAIIGREGTGIVNQTGGTVIEEYNTIDLGQVQNSFAGNGTWNYYGGTLESGLLASTSLGTAGIRLGGATASGAAGTTTGTMRVYNTGPDGHIRTLNFLVSSGSANNGSQGTVEFHYGLNQENVGGVRPIQVERNLGIFNSTTTFQSARLGLVLDAAPTVVGGVPQNLGLFDYDFTGAGTGSIVGNGSGGDPSRVFYDEATGTIPYAEGSTVSATFGSETYNWTISYTGKINWSDPNDSVISSITGVGTGKSVVLIGESVTSSLLLGDLNFDGHVDAKDIAAMELALTNMNSYLSTNFGNGTPASHGVTASNIGQYADVSGGGKFNNADMQALLTYLKNGHGSLSAVPEPSTFVLAGFGLAALGLSAARRRKAA